MRVLLYTLGCKVNQSEGTAIRALLEQRGHVLAEGGGPVDAIVVNTCTVTGTSDQKSRQAIRRLRRAHPGALLAVCGCMAQVNPEAALSLGASLVGGTSDRTGFVDALERLVRDAPPEHGALLLPGRPGGRFEPLPAARGTRSRAVLKIQDGCENHCTYCIIPQARGPSRSLPPDAVREAASRLDSAEIVLTGIEIAAYGLDLGGAALIDAVEAAAAGAPWARIRLGSLEPRAVTGAFLQSLAAQPVCPHFHLSLQSGCDRTLRRMGRRYDTARFWESCALVRRFFPGCAVTTDLIVGFPGETEEDFAQTLAFVERCDFAGMHIFPYSRRGNTPAARLPEQLPRAVKQRRSGEAAALSEQMAARYRDRQLGRVLPVLFETERDGAWRGTSDNYQEVEAQGSGLRGSVFSVRITRVAPLGTLEGVVEPL